jgi:UDP-N-acetyl-2-amino-2-deoxyglucuronate dehydrogenase
VDNYVLLGAAGYVSPKHLRAIKDTGGNLLAVMDPHDSVGVLDSFFPSCKYFREFERFDRFCSKINQRIDYVVVCSPNYLHDSHCRFGLRLGTDVICEKPVVLNERNLDELQNMEVKTGHMVNTILQLRLNPQLQELKNKISRNHKVFLEYYTPRGPWYLHSWKGDVAKSGGLGTNIGIHLFDLMVWLFGPKFDKPELIIKTPTTIGGFLHLDKASVSFELSIEKGPKRRLVIDNEDIEFSKGFADLHTESYRHILAGGGFDLNVARPSIQICEEIRK